MAEAKQTVVQNAPDLVEMGRQSKLAVQELRRARVLAEQRDETREVDQRQS